jgi:FHA domain-containing protein
MPMPITIRAKLLRDSPLSQTLNATFDERGGTIGRSDANTLTLPDPERHVSRLHAEVLFKAPTSAHPQGHYVLRNVGSANPVMHNARLLGPGEVTSLAQADRLTIGGYELTVDVVRGPNSLGAGAQATPSADVFTVIRASAKEGRTHPATPAEPKTMPGGTVRPADPIADLLGPPSISPSASRSSPPTSSSSPSPAKLPDDFDPFADLVTPQPLRAAPSDPFSPTGDDTVRSGLTDLLGPSLTASPSIDALFGLAGTPADAFAHPSAASTAPQATQPPAATPSDHVSDLHAAFVPPRVKVPFPDTKHGLDDWTDTPKPAAMASPAAVASVVAREDIQTNRSTHEGSEPLWRALCDGAGIPATGQQTLTPELMHMVGATLRQAVEGTLHLINLRTAAKQELRAQVTTIQSKHNNPLKFAPDAATATRQLLSPPVQGFMPAPKAMNDAMIDLMGHTMGTMAGTQAALRSMLTRFEPAELESRLSGGGLLDKVLPSQRQARLWALYLEHHARITQDAQEDFHSAFGRTFTKTYEAECDRLAAQFKPPTG